MYDVTNYTISSADAGFLGAIIAFLMAWMFLAIAIGIFMIVCTWRVFAKAGKPGWAALIPIYNVIVLLQVANMHWAWIFLPFAAFIPFVGWIGTIVYAIMVAINLAKAFGKEGGFAVGLIFLQPIFIAILAFDKSQHQVITKQ